MEQAEKQSWSPSGKAQSLKGDRKRRKDKTAFPSPNSYRLSEYSSYFKTSPDVLLLGSFLELAKLPVQCQQYHACASVPCLYGTLHTYLYDTLSVHTYTILQYNCLLD